MAIRLKELTIEQIKNVDHGQIKLYDNTGFLNVLGIYGQNGSGKTTVVDTMEIVKTLIAGHSLPDHCKGIFNIQEDKLPRIQIEIEKEGALAIRYEVAFIADESTVDQTVIVAQETISYKQLLPRERFNRLFHYSVLNLLEGTENDAFAGELKTRSKILSKDAIEVLTTNSMENQSSFLFSKGFRTRLDRIEGKEIEKEVLETLKQFSDHIRIFTQRDANLSGMGAIPININYQDDTHGFKGTLPAILVKGGCPVPAELLHVYEETIQYLNEIIPSIIPDLQLEMRVGDTQVDQNETTYHNVNFFANRNGKIFSLIHESEGIRKIISMIGILIEVFNNADIIAVIDELDSGVFEYLLGELMQIFSLDTKGQLIFTSHNLRILEMLPPRQIRFSTTNPTNRYLTLKGVKNTNNLRDVYIRTLYLGGAEEELYKGQSQSKIRRSLGKAGQSIGE